MKLGDKTAMGLAAGLALSLTAHAVTPDNPSSSSGPYQTIVDRNVFGLRPPPPPPDPAELNKPKPVNITLTGILAGKVFGGKKALMKTPPAPSKPGEPPPQEHSMVLGIGEADGDVQVLEIDEKAGSVKVKNAGEVVTLTFKDNGLKPSAGAPVPGAPPGLPTPTGFPGQPPMKAAGGFQPPAGNPGFSMPARNVRTGLPGSASTYNPYNPQNSAGYGTTAGSGINSSTPGYGYNPSVATTASSGNPGALSMNSLTAPATQPGQFKSWPPENFSMSPEQEALLNYAQRQKDPGVPPIPGIPDVSQLDGTTAPVNQPPTQHGPSRLPTGQILPQ